jgi:hypothetical protein
MKRKIEKNFFLICKDENVAMTNNFLAKRNRKKSINLIIDYMLRTLALVAQKVRKFVLKD